MIQDASVYSDAEHFARELRILFREGPTFVWLSANCAQPGNYLVASVGGIPVAVVRHRWSGRLPLVCSCSL